MFTNVQSRIGYKQFIIMATACATSSQCTIVTKFQINKIEQHFVYKDQIVAQPAYFSILSA